MKIAYLSQYFSTPDMPGDSRSYEMGRHLAGMGHEVHMITTNQEATRSPSKNWRLTEEAGITVHWLDVPYSNSMSYGERIKAFLRFALKAGPRAAGLKGDVIFATSTPLTIALPGIYAAKRCRVPMVFEVRDLWPEMPIALGALKNPFSIMAAKWLERMAYNNSAHIVALSPGMKEGVISRGYPDEQITVIPNSCDLDFFNVGKEPGQILRNKNEWLQQRPLVIYTGTIGLINGLGYLVRLADYTMKLDPEIRFLVIGTGREEMQIRKLAEDLGVMNRNFFMMPSIAKKEIPAWYSAADVATSITIDDEIMLANSANKFFDTLAAGKPIAINYGGWQAEIIQDTGSGLVLDPRNIEKSAADLVARIRDSDWLERAGRAALQAAEERFDRGKLAKQLERILSDQASFSVVEKMAD